MQTYIRRFLWTTVIAVLLLLGVSVTHWIRAFGDQPKGPAPHDDAQIAATYTKDPDYFLPTHAAPAPIVRHTFYTLSYLEAVEQAQWVAYPLTADMLVARAKRNDCFRADPTVATESATPADYRRSGYDKGHLKPAADAAFAQEAMDETFFMSNMSPQVPGFNRGIWKSLEEQVRGWVRADQPLYIVTGPIFAEGAKTIGQNQVAVPKAYYKVILDYTLPDIKGIGFILDNKKTTRPLNTFACTIGRVEQITAIDFFPQLPDELEKTLEAQADMTVWKTKAP